MPRRQTHPNLKLIQGTTRADRAHDQGAGLPLVDHVPDPPEWLADPVALEEWHRLAGILTACRILPAGALSALAMLCALHGKLVQAFTAGETPKSALIAQYRALSNDFGIPPAAQGKVTPRAPHRENPFACNVMRSA